MISVLSKHAGYGPDGLRRMFFDLGGDSPPPPDYTPLANASKESAEIMAGLGREQLTEARRQYDLNRESITPIVTTQKQIMDESLRQAQDYDTYNKTTFRPIEQQLAQEAQEFSTEGAREGFARKAVSDLEQAQSNEAAQADRAMVAAGVNPNSGRFAGLKRIQSITNAGARAGAATGARERADALGWAKKMDVTGLGRNLPGASSAAYQVATGAGNSAAGNQMAPSSQLLTGMAQGASTIGQGQSNLISGLSNIANMQTGTYNASLNSDGGLGGLGSLLGGAAAVGRLFVPSSEEMKDEKAPVSGRAITKGLQKIPVESWDYKDGVEDGARHVGPYAEDVHAVFGDVAAPGGKQLDMVTMSGLTLAAVKDLAGRLDKVERKAGMRRV